MNLTPLRFSEDELLILDQTALPLEERWEKIETLEDLSEAIKSLKIRGAPLLGVVVAVSLAFFAGQAERKKENWAEKFPMWIKEMLSFRPTAVNPRNHLARMNEVFLQAHKEGKSPGEIVHLLWDEAKKIAREEKEICEKISEYGASLIGRNSRILTHCNTGALATYGTGTALGIIRKCAEEGKNPFVWVTETRPLLQGSRLTAFELEKLHIPYSIIVDSAVGDLFSKGEVQYVLVGADRIARNGDTANKIGTKTLALLAHLFQIPFLVAAPLSSFDPDIPSKEYIPIEFRKSEEILSLGSQPVAPGHFQVYNPAFDITESSLVTAFITEEGIYRPFHLDLLYQKIPPRRLE
ncbi:MAG: S-methyl-5-thioribose-1-phosphate isomerase [bacterium JZ-2024 1]